MLVISAGPPPEHLSSRATLILQRNQSYSEAIQALPLPNGLRLTLACDAAVLAVEHQGAIGLLALKAHYAVAHSTIRPLMETTLRSIWLMYCASYESVQWLSNGRRTMDLDDMARAIAKSQSAAKVKPIAEAVLNAKSIFHSFAHAGIEQLTRRRNGFEPKEVHAGMYMADTFAAVACACLSRIYAAESLQREINRQARDVAIEGHEHFGGVLPGEDFDPTMPPLPDWRDPS